MDGTGMEEAPRTAHERRGEAPGHADEQEGERVADCGGLFSRGGLGTVWIHRWCGVGGRDQ